MDAGSSKSKGAKSPRKMSFEQDPPEIAAYDVDPWDQSKKKKGKKGRFGRRSDTQVHSNPLADEDWPTDRKGRMRIDKHRGQEMILNIRDFEQIFPCKLHV